MQISWFVTIRDGVEALSLCSETTRFFRFGFKEGRLGRAYDED